MKMLVIIVFLLRRATNTENIRHPKANHNKYTRKPTSFLPPLNIVYMLQIHQSVAMTTTRGFNRLIQGIHSTFILSK